MFQLLFKYLKASSMKISRISEVVIGIIEQGVISIWEIIVSHFASQIPSCSASSSSSSGQNFAFLSSFFGCIVNFVILIVDFEMLYSCLSCIHISMSVCMIMYVSVCALGVQKEIGSILVDLLERISIILSHHSTVLTPLFNALLHTRNIKLRLNIFSSFVFLSSRNSMLAG